MVRRSPYPLVLLVALGMITAGAATGTAEPRNPDGVAVWLTDLSTDDRLTRQADLSWTGAAPGAGTVITVDPTRAYQRMTGFGASLTDSSAWVITEKLSGTARAKIMRELFSAEDGIGLSVLRQPMGASDFAVERAYSYDDQPEGETDPDLSEFSVDHDRDYLLPRLREALTLNPELTVMASPWSAPGWMKDSDSMITGSLLPRYHASYARYFVKFLQAYAKAGVPVRYVTAQNEPLYEPADYPGQGMPPEQAVEFIGDHLGPAIAGAGLDTEILGYDHNWDVTDYPEALQHDRRAARYVPGTAWHCYGGGVPAQSVSHNNYPRAQAFLTECSGGDWQGTEREAFTQTMGSVIGVPRNWGQSVILWNLALDERKGPYIGGCSTCRGVITVNDDGTVDKELEYWALGHASRFVRPGAARIASSVAADEVINVAFRNPDGSTVLIAHNASGSARSLTVRVGDRSFEHRLPAGAAATYRWTGAVPDSPADPDDLGSLDLDFGRGPAGTPGGRLLQTVSAETVAELNQVRVGDDWFAYSLPYGAALTPTGPVESLPRKGWRATASHTEQDGAAARMLDGDQATRWSSGAGQSPGEWVRLDFGTERTFDQVRLSVGANVGDYVRAYRLETSADGETWTPVARGRGSTGTMIIPLPRTTTRHLRLVSEGSSGSWWSITEFGLAATGEAAPAAAAAPDGRVRTRTAELAGVGTVTGTYNPRPDPATLTLPVPGLRYRYVLPGTAAATFLTADQSLPQPFSRRVAAGVTGRSGAEESGR
ncbi:discoidin domain-containing protein [Microlunatus parietis]|uniref:O-glycosyl hydrolase n=1 Tax=Microlunatus parietis TaxID=682979 RepID=A0A7Y9IBT3_9ACTN|nr:discoidin domain-containing protein [Microlunatus parietis]NYE73748.1 O-glycosyl hydrolase [Microlunatus parietis]